jgi:hypothetical protein
MFIARDDEIIAAFPMARVVVCSHFYAEIIPRPDCYMTFPHDDGGGCTTKLPHNTVARCAWTVELPTDIREYDVSRVGYLQPKFVEPIIIMVNKVRRGCWAKVPCGHKACRPANAGDD